jgi:hypothetical protein
MRASNANAAEHSFTRPRCPGSLHRGPRGGDLDPPAYQLQEIAPIADGVELDYLDAFGKTVRVFFNFTADGKIARMHCVV